VRKSDRKRISLGTQGELRKNLIRQNERGEGKAYETDSEEPTSGYTGIWRTPPILLGGGRAGKKTARGEEKSLGMKKTRKKIRARAWRRVTPGGPGLLRN